MGLNAELTRFWRTSIRGVRDLTGGGNMRSLGIDLTYEDECLVFSTNLSRDFFEDRELRPSDGIMFRLTFKTLGEVASGVTKLQ